MIDFRQLVDVLLCLANNVMLYMAFKLGIQKVVKRIFELLNGNSWGKKCIYHFHIITLSGLFQIIISDYVSNPCQFMVVKKAFVVRTVCCRCCSPSLLASV